MSIQQKVRTAVTDLLESDLELFQIDAGERAITSQFGGHLRVQFPDWNVDCEYNRNYEVVKRLYYERNGDYAEHLVVPDIIIHRRRTDQNILIIEVKKSTNTQSDENDLNRIEAFSEQLGYKAALFVRFLAGEEETRLVTEVWRGGYREDL